MSYVSKTVKIDVTQADIDTGEKGSCGKCPIALAVCRAIPEAREVAVGNDTIDFELPGVEGLASGNTPREADDFIVAFDEHGPLAVSPFSFGLTYTYNAV